MYYTLFAALLTWSAVAVALPVEASPTLVSFRSNRWEEKWACTAAHSVSINEKWEEKNASTYSINEKGEEIKGKPFSETENTDPVPADTLLPSRKGECVGDSLHTAEVVSLRRLPQTAHAHPVQRLDQTDILRRGITSMTDALRRFAGVNVRDYGGAGGLKTVSVRGLGAQHTAVALDGICVSDAQTGQTDLSRFDVERMGAMELQMLDYDRLLCPVRNLAAAVLNITSRNVFPKSGSVGGDVAVGAGSFGTWRTDAALRATTLGGTRIGVGGSYFFGSNDYPFRLENGAATTTRRRANSRMQRAVADMDVYQPLRGGEVSGKIYMYHSYRRLPGMVRYYVNENNERLTDQNAFAQLRYAQKRERWQWMSAVKYNRTNSLYDNFDRQYPDGRLSRHYRQHEAYATAGAAYNIYKGLAAAYATDYGREWMTSNVRTDRTVCRDAWLQSLSLRCEWGGWTLTARGAYHRYWNGREGGGSATDARRLTPSFTLMWRFCRGRTEWNVRGGYKETFRVPTFSETYYYHLGTATLKPELTRQISLGTTLHTAPARWLPLVVLTMDGYANHVSDRITAVPYTQNVWRMQNMGRVETRGADATLRIDLCPLRRHLVTLSGNYTYQRSEDRTSRGEASYRKQLPYVPLHSGGVSVLWDNPWLSLSLHGAFASRRWASTAHLPTTDLDAYAEWGATAYHTFALGRTRLTLRADLINAFDQRYEVIRFYPMPGRSVEAKASVCF